MVETLEDILRPLAVKAHADLAAAEAHEANCKEPFCAQCRRFPCEGCGQAEVSWRRAHCAECETKAHLAEFRRLALETIPTRFGWADFANPCLRERVKPAEAVSQGQALIGRPNIVLVGPAGSGKTSLAIAMLRQAIESVPVTRRRRCTQRFTSAYALNKARSMHPLGEGEAPLVAAAMNSELLVIDDLGAEIDRHGTAVSEVIYERHNDELPTWVTTGFSPKELADRYGGGIARRVFEGATPVALTAGGKAR
jgi:DNA replication protein DnaC